MAGNAIAAQPRNIVIIGGGVIGVLSAYYLTRHPTFSAQHHTITIVEASDLASGASGKAGGLLATWAYPKCIVSLSFKLHKELAREHGGVERWGYRAVEAGMVRAKVRPGGQKDKESLLDAKRMEEQEAGGNDEAQKEQATWEGLPKVKRQKIDLYAESEAEEDDFELPKDLNWLDDNIIMSYDVMGSTSQTAQVHPELFTKSIAQLAVEAGAKIILGSATKINYSKDQQHVESITYTEKETQEVKLIEASDVVVATGPWTRSLLPKAPIEPLRAHSVVMKADVTPFAVFTEIELPDGWEEEGKRLDGVVGNQAREDHHLPNEDGEEALQMPQTQAQVQAQKTFKHPREVNPEMYARPDGTIYACGEGDSLVPLPSLSSLVEVDLQRCQNLHAYLSLVSPSVRHASILKQQACYLPVVTDESGPLIGKTKCGGLFVATGHTCWGIQNSAATGKLISEFVFEGKARSAGIKKLDPRLWGL